MTADDAQRMQLLQRAIARHSGAPTDVAGQLWKSLAPELTSIIGENGFSALYLRSLHLASAAFPWLAIVEAGDGMPRNTLAVLAPRTVGSADSLYADLVLSLRQRTTAEANDAILMLFTVFTDILASLIGESITIDILRSAWGDDASATDLPGKEFPNE